MKINRPFKVARWIFVGIVAVMFALLFLGNVNIYLAIAGALFAGLVISFLFRILALILEKEGYLVDLWFFF